MAAKREKEPAGFVDREDTDADSWLIGEGSGASSDLQSLGMVAGLRYWRAEAGAGSRRTGKVRSASAKPPKKTAE